MMWVAEGLAVGAFVWLIGPVPQILSYSLSDRCKKLCLATALALCVGLAVLANGLKFYGIIPIGEKQQ